MTFELVGGGLGSIFQGGDLLTIRARQCAVETQPPLRGVKAVVQAGL